MKPTTSTLVKEAIFTVLKDGSEIKSWKYLIVMKYTSQSVHHLLDTQVMINFVSFHKDELICNKGILKNEDGYFVYPNKQS